MKKFTLLLLAGVFATLLPSCCGLSSKLGFGSCKKSGSIVRVGCENDKYTTKEVTKYKIVKRMVNPGTKGGIPYEVEDKVAYTETVKVKKRCGICGSVFNPSSGCCGVISPAVLKRATAQGGTGEPHIGLIPTMKILAE